MFSLLIKKIKPTLFLCLSTVFVFCFPFQTHADLAPQIFITNLKISGVENNEITGEFTVWNYEKYYLSDLNYEIKLFQGTEFDKFQLIDVVVPNEIFFIPPNKTVTKSFTFQYPKNIASGDYTLRAQIITARGSELGWNDQIVSLQGASKFLDILNASSRVLVGQEQAFPLTGINVSPQDDVAVFLKVKNPGDAITVVPNIKIFKRQFNMPLAQEYQDSPITFAKGETKDINLTMPKLDTPESYLAEVKFFQNNEQVSGIQYFRWVVKGEGGKILYIRADKDYYKAGESINLIIESIGPADFSDIGSGKLEITVSDKDGNLITKTSKDVSLNSDLVSSIISIPVKNDLISPKIDVKLTKDGKILDERIINLPIFSKQAQQIEKGQIIKKYLIYLIPVISLIMILIICFSIFRFRINKK